MSELAENKVSCEILCVGTELLLGDILNTNAQYLAQELSRLGLDVFWQTVVGDNPQRLARTLELSRERANIVLLTGGLGPTADDLTKETVAGCYGYELAMHEPSKVALEDYFARTGRVCTPNNYKQAMMPKGGIVLENPQGTAPGCIMEDRRACPSPDSMQGLKVAIMMPGPPREMRPMFRNLVRPYLQRFSRSVLVSRFVRVMGLGESHMAHILSDILAESLNPTVAPYAKDGECLLRLTAKAADAEEALKLIEPVLAVIKERLGDYIYAVDEGHPLNLEGCVAKIMAAAPDDSDLSLSMADALSGGQAYARLRQAAAALPEGRAADLLGLGLCGRCLRDWQLSLGLQAPEISYDPLQDSANFCLEMACAISGLARTAWGCALCPAVCADPCEEQWQGRAFVALAGPDFSRVLSLDYGARDRAYVMVRATNELFNLMRQTWK